MNSYFENTSVLLRSLFKDAGIGCYIIDSQYIVRFINRRAEEITGFSANDSVGKKCEACCAISNHTGSNVCRDACLMQKAFTHTSSEDISSQEYRCATKSGVSVCVRLVPIPLRDADGLFAGGVILFFDMPDAVASQQRLERQSEALRKAEQKYQKLFESSRDGIIFCGFDGTIHNANPAFLYMLGYTMVEVSVVTHQRLTPIEWQSVDDYILEYQIMKIGYSDVYEKKYIRKDGSLVAVSVRGWLSNNEEGMPEGVWYVITDITAHKQVESSLKKSRESLRLIFDSSPLGMFYFSGEGSVTLCNEAVCRILGCGREDIIGTNIFTHAPDQQLASALEYCRQGQTGYYVSEYSRQDGTVILLRMIFNPVLSGAGEFDGGVGIIENVDEFRKKI